MSSTRLPSKVMLEVFGKPLILMMLERVARCALLDGLWLATSDDPSDDPLAETVKDAGYKVFRGSLENVLSRFWHIGKSEGADAVVRLTGDCPLHDPEVIDAVIDMYARNRGGMDYVSNVLPPTFPDGLDTEVLSFELLDLSYRNATEKQDLEHVVLWARRRVSETGRKGNFVGPADFSHLRWTLDEPQDYAFITQVYEGLYAKKREFGWLDVVAWLTQDPKRLMMNSMHERNEGSRKKPQAKTSKEPVHSEETI